MSKCIAYVGLDVHKETIAVAVARPRGGEVTSFGVIAPRPAAVRKLLAKLSPNGQVLELCYEAGPCGYGLYRTLTEMGHRCRVVAPGLVPRKPGERVKTDRRDALTLARLLRAGELTPVWVPGPEQEAIRDLTRAREDMKAAQLKARQRLSAFLLRHGRVYREGKSAWTQQHARWLQAQSFAQPVQQIVFQEYVDAVTAAGDRVAGLDEQIRTAVPDWSLAPVAHALMALRGVNLLTAVTVLAELGDLTRFDQPRQLMGFLGLVPGEHSSGARRRQGAITKTGNGHARRVLVEAAWSYRFPARQTAHLQRKGGHAPAEVQAIAWKAQKRLCGRYRTLARTGKPACKVATAIARELAGYLWAIARTVDVRPRASA